jgi:uncharacterized protein YggT (Ycf19 family)
MTYREGPPPDETEVVETERVVERPVEPVAPAVERERVVERPVAAAPVQAPPASQVNVAGPAGPAYVATAPGPLYYARRVVALVFGILFALLLLRILLLLLGANEGNGLVDFIYSVTEPFVAPFRGVFSMDTIRPVGRSVFDVAAVVALVGYVLIELLILAILRLPDRDRVVA